MRWYENNIELNELLNFIQTLDYEDRVTLAGHLLLILVNESDLDLDSEINEIANKNYSYKRWYDEIVDLSSAMEFLKKLPESKQNYVVNRFMSEIVMSYVKKEIY